MTVTDQKSNSENEERPVGVWFGQPDQEIRSQSYPYVTIDMVDVFRDTTREHRGKVAPSYLAPTGLSDDEDWEVDFPIPMNIDYQITTFARHPKHDREIMAQLMYLKLPVRFGVLEVEDGTVRRLDVLNIAKRDVTEGAKRLFMNAITVRVSSELSQAQIATLYKVREIQIENPANVRNGGRPGNPYFIGDFEQTIVE
jgi:hypothetical protein